MFLGVLLLALVPCTGAADLVFGSINCDLAVCSSCTFSWSGGGAGISAHVVNDKGSSSTCAINAEDDGCRWTVDLAPQSSAQLVVSSNGTEYTMGLGTVKCATGCAAFESVCSSSDSTTDNSRSTTDLPSPSAPPSPSSDAPSHAASDAPSPSGASGSTTSSTHPPISNVPSSAPQNPTSTDPRAASESKAPITKMTTRVSTAPPTEITTTDDQGRTTTITVPGVVTTDVSITVETPEQPEGLSTGAVAAIAAVGGVVGVALLVGAFVAWRKSKRKRNEMELEDTILFGGRPSSAADPFLGPFSNARFRDAEEVLDDGAHSRQSSLGGAGIASTFPSRYHSPYSPHVSPAGSPIMRATPSRSSSRPSSLALSNSVIGLSGLATSSSSTGLSGLVLSDPASAEPTTTTSRSRPSSYADNDIAEFVTTSTRVTRDSLVPALAGREPSSSRADTETTVDQTAEGRMSSNPLPSVSSRERRGSRHLNSASEPLLGT